ncbi:MAG: aminopeptidase [Lachnospiraceae bacterium]|nr:aminopeptidase [Lachnospiraceae bacterium]
MDYKAYFKEDNTKINERFLLASDRIAELTKELKDSTDTALSKTLKEYFYEQAAFLNMINNLYISIDKDILTDMSLEELQRINTDLYMDIEGDNYNISYTNPEYVYNRLLSDYSEKTAGKLAKLLTFLSAELRACISFAYEHRLVNITVVEELFLEIYYLFCDDDNDICKEVKSAIYYYVSDYSDIDTEYIVKERFDPELDFATDIIMNSDLTDMRYLYKYGEYITDNEIDTAKYLNSLSQEEIDAMAETYTKGYHDGFIIQKIDLSKKQTVNIRYHIGFERMVKAAILQFKEIGLTPVIYRAGKTARQRRVQPVGFYSSSPNNQYDYDHRYDKAVFFDKPLMDKFLVNLRMAYEKYADKVSSYAGPAVIEVYGEKPFEPAAAPHASKPDSKQEELFVNFNMNASLLLNEFVPQNTISFTIIAYPIPEIGERFEEIFKETVKVNTLDVDIYRNIHQAIIDTLDTGDYVHIKGMNGNRTDLKVNLYKLKDPDKETIFENCLADVNIPVGEVFTSPVLKDTNGTLHVTKVYLNGLKYIDLELTITDGMVSDYTCKNFDTEEENKKFIKENLLFNHKSLPMGEFAIGTNTTAYKMGRTYDINAILPILIAEKTGPHFAFGDTCYSMSEDTKLYNPDGKEIVAKENEISILRKTDMDKAYFNCHTDITIPYDELGSITVYTKDNTAATIIENGRFVLSGTEYLNEALD